MDQVSANDLKDESNRKIGPSPPPLTKQSENLKKTSLPYEIINGIPCYQCDHVIDGVVKIFERIGFDDKVGATFLGIDENNKELVVRVAPSEITAHPVRVEAAFLCKVEAENDWLYFSQVHKIFQTDDAFHLTLFFRGGPTLEQCFNFRNQKFTIGTAGRLAEDILQIIQCAHKHGYLVRCFNLDCFHFDAACRHLFMADISSLIKDISKTELKLKNPAASYLGSSDFAPIVHHEGGHISARQDLESWLYLFIYLFNGLPWVDLRIDEAAQMKKKLVETGKLFEGLPEKFKEIASIIFVDEQYSDVADDNYEKLIQLTQNLYREVGKVEDHEDNMDFEREPTPEEIPRLVLCRDDEEIKSGEEESKNEDEEIKNEDEEIKNEDEETKS